MTLYSSDDLVKRLRETTHMYQVDCELKMECADRIEQLAATNEELSNCLAVFESNIKELFVLLERVEETDEGRRFHPVQISCCRALDGVKLEQVLRKLKGGNA